MRITSEYKIIGTTHQTKSAKRRLHSHAVIIILVPILFEADRYACSHVLKSLGLVVDGYSKRLRFVAHPSHYTLIRRSELSPFYNLHYCRMHGKF
eukprot:SAG22_NODE_259_length_13477_cov_10.020407_10_plen_95_part_00